VEWSEGGKRSVEVDLNLVGVEVLVVPIVDLRMDLIEEGRS